MNTHLKRRLNADTVFIWFRMTVASNLILNSAHGWFVMKQHMLITFFNLPFLVKLLHEYDLKTKLIKAALIGAAVGATMATVCTYVREKKMHKCCH